PCSCPCWRPRDGRCWCPRVRRCCNPRDRLPTCAPTRRRARHCGPVDQRTADEDPGKGLRATEGEALHTRDLAGQSPAQERACSRLRQGEPRCGHPRAYTRGRSFSQCRATIRTCSGTDSRQSSLGHLVCVADGVSTCRDIQQHTQCEPVTIDTCQLLRTFPASIRGANHRGLRLHSTGVDDRHVVGRYGTQRARELVIHGLARSGDTWGRLPFRVHHAGATRGTSSRLEGEFADTADAIGVYTLGGLHKPCEDGEEGDRVAHGTHLLCLLGPGGVPSTCRAVFVVRQVIIACYRTQCIAKGRVPCVCAA